MQGTIKRIKEKGFGFIMPDDRGKDVFFHARSLRGIRFEELQEGQRVEFEITDGEKGPAAVDVTLISE